MPIPEPFTPAAITAGVLTNIATDIIKHHAQALESTLVGRMLKQAGLIEPNFDDRLRDSLSKALGLYFETYPQYKLTGVTAFFQDPDVAQQIGGYILDRQPIEEEKIQSILEQHLGQDATTRMLVKQRGLEPERIVPDFLECYRQVLSQQLSVPQMAILLETVDQTESLVKEIRASEARLEKFITELLKHKLSSEALHAVHQTDRQELAADLIQPDQVTQFPPHSTTKISGDTMIWARDDKEMVPVPAGKFLYGDEKKKVDLSEFWIDKTPVTNAEYKRFLDANPDYPIPFFDMDWAKPYNWNRESRTFPKGKADHPVVLVSGQNAEAYAEWAGKRLPTQEEWQKAARGIDGRKYPWGDQKPTPKLCNYKRNEGGTTPVGKYSPEGDSPYGCVDMSGNVWEWTASNFDKNMIICGGDWEYPKKNVRAASCLSVPPSRRNNEIGFRCVVDSGEHLATPHSDQEIITQERHMPENWLPSDFMLPLRQVLLDCGPFDTDRQLRAVFAHPTLRLWRDRLPGADNKQDRVDYTINFLLDQYTSEGANGLILFLQVLTERINPGDACHHRLAELARQLEAAHRGNSSATQPVDWTGTRAATRRVSERPLSSPGPIRDRWALLVGINRYNDPSFAPLNFCVNDVIALQQVLEGLEYKVLGLHDNATEARLQPTKDNIEAELIAICEAVGPDDLLWVHFACHGQIVDGRPILITQQTRARTLASSGLPLLKVEEQIKASQAGRLIITLDACHVGVEVGRGGSDPEFNRRVYDLAQGFALIAASTAQQKAQEWREKEHGVFTYYLLEGLNGEADQDSKQFVTVDDLKDYVLNQLRIWNPLHGGLLQEPTARTEGLGSMILADYRTD